MNNIIIPFGCSCATAARRHMTKRKMTQLVGMVTEHTHTLASVLLRTVVGERRKVK